MRCGSVRRWLIGQCILAVSGVVAMVGAPASGEVALRVVRPDRYQAPNLLVNPGFEQGQAANVPGWRAWQKGFTVVPGAGRAASRGVVCESANAQDQYGASQTVELNQPQPYPIVIRGWSRAEGVSGTPDSGYSLYADLIYDDNTPLWGQTADFSTGTHDWQHRECIILPQKPVRRLTLHCLFRQHTGKVWFDDIELCELRAPGGMAVFDGVVVEPMRAAGAPERVASVQTQDGLEIRHDPTSGRIASLRVDGKDYPAGDLPSGFCVRDVAANSDFETFEGGQALGLRLQAKFEGRDNCIAVSGSLTDLTGNDRAVTLVYALPLDPGQMAWWNNILDGTFMQQDREYSVTVPIGAGATGTMSLYPLAAVTEGTPLHMGPGRPLVGPGDTLTNALLARSPFRPPVTWGNWTLGLGIDMEAPCQYRIAFNAATHHFYIAFDFGLTKDTLQFPSSAPFRFAIFLADPKWGFRGALAKYAQLYPHLFEVRSPKQGIWMPFTDVSTVEGWQDFGFRYHEGTNNVPFDDENDILSFRYTEPMTYWMRMDKAVPRTYDAAVAQLNQQAAGQNEAARREAVAVLASGSHDEDGRFQMRFLDTPWCDGAVFSLCPLPGIPGEWTDAKLAWNPDIKERCYGAQAKGVQDGEYLDSLEGYVTANLNFRREHFAAATVPLTFDSQSKRPAIHKAFAVYEFVRWISQDVHQMGKLMMANAVPHRFTFLCGQLDVMGTETDWARGGKWQPMSHSQLAMVRSMCGKKPYLFLMNTDYDQFPRDMVEKYFQRSLFWGMFPSMFSPTASSFKAYWRTPAYYNRDRDLFKKYQPIIKQVAEAGWEPLTYATVEPQGLLIERFGPDKERNLYLTMFNDGQAAVAATVTVEAQPVNLPPTLVARELISGVPVAVDHDKQAARFRIEVQPEQAAVVCLAPGWE